MVAAEVVEVVGHRTAHHGIGVAVERVEDRDRGGGPGAELRNPNRPRQVRPGPLGGQSADRRIGRGGPRRDDLQRAIGVMTQKGPDGELSGQPSGQISQQSHRVIEGRVTAVQHSPVGDRGRHRPDHPAAERRRAVPSRTHHRGQRREVTGDIGQQRITEQVGTPAQRQRPQPGGRGPQGGQGVCRGGRLDGHRESRCGAFIDQFLGQRHAAMLATGSDASA